MMFYLTLPCAPIFVVERMASSIVSRFLAEKISFDLSFELKNEELKIAATKESSFDVQKIE